MALKISREKYLQKVTWAFVSSIYDDTMNHVHGEERKNLVYLTFIFGFNKIKERGDYGKYKYEYGILPKHIFESGNDEDKLAVWYFQLLSTAIKNEHIELTFDEKNKIGNEIMARFSQDLSAATTRAEPFNLIKLFKRIEENYLKLEVLGLNNQQFEDYFKNASKIIIHQLNSIYHVSKLETKNLFFAELKNANYIKYSFQINKYLSQVLKGYNNYLLDNLLN